MWAKRGGAIATMSAAVLLTASSVRPASASCPVDPSVRAEGRGLSTVSPSARLSFITNRLDLGAKRALAWSLGWGLTYGTAAVTQMAVTPAISEGNRVVLYVGAASATIGTLVRAVNIPHVIRERRRLRRYLRSAPDECAALREAERALARSARWEKRSTTLLLHFGALAYSVGTGLVLALAFNRPMAGHRQLAIGASAGQLMLVTTPQVTLDALTTYRQGHLERLSRLRTFPLVLPGGGGVAIGGLL